MKQKKQVLISGFALLLVLLFILYFGIRLKGYDPDNHTYWRPELQGLEFKSRSMIYTEKNFLQLDKNYTDLTIELAIQPVFPETPSFRFIVLVYGKNEKDQLLIGQWDNSLVIMNGNDYSNRRRSPKLYVPLEKNDKIKYVTIVSRDTVTSVYVNGERIKKSTNLGLSFPDKKEQPRLLIGNSIIGKNSWVGTFCGLALFDRALSESSISRHYVLLNAANDFNTLYSEQPNLLYTFDEGVGNVVYEKMKHGMDINIPVHRAVLNREILSWPIFGESSKKGMLFDILINLAGFIPLGFFLTKFVCLLSKKKHLCSLWFTVTSVFFLSLFIELYQVCIPSRSSSLLDLILNTIGGILGYLIYIQIELRSKRQS